MVNILRNKKQIIAHNQKRQKNKKFSLGRPPGAQENITELNSSQIPLNSPITNKVLHVRKMEF